MFYEDSMDQEKLKQFIIRLIKGNNGRKVFFIVDNLKAHFLGQCKNKRFKKQCKSTLGSTPRRQPLEAVKKQRADLGELEIGIEIYRKTRLMDLLKEQIASLTVEAEGLQGEITQRQYLLDNQKNYVRRSATPAP